MKRVLLSLLLLGFCGVTPVEAKVLSATGGVVIKEGEVIEDDLVVVAETIEIKGIINGDLYTAGGVIAISGKVNGDLLVAGGSVHLDGADIRDDLRVAGGNIALINTKVGDNLTLLGGAITTSQIHTGGSVITGGGLLLLDGQIGGNVYGGAGTTMLSGQVAKEVVISTDSLVIGDNTTINQAVTYYSTQDVVISDTASVRGEITKKLPPDFKPVSGFISDKTNSLVYFFLSSLLIGALLIYCLPQPMLSLAATTTNQLTSTIKWGLLLIALPIPTLGLLLISVVGIPLALIIGLVYALVFLIAPVIIGMWLGQFIAKNINQVNLPPLVQLTLGIAAYYLLSAIPWLNLFVWLIARIIALGSVFLYQKRLLLSYTNDQSRVN